MAQLDVLLSAIVTQNAQSLRAEGGAQATLEIGGARRPITRAALTNEQIAALLKEISDPAQRAAVDAAQPVTISRAAGDATFTVEAAVDAGRWQVVDDAMHSIA